MKKKILFYGLSLICIIFLQSLHAEKTFTIFFTNDWHSDFTGFRSTDHNEIIGGVARLSTLLSEKTAMAIVKGPVLILDAGDFTMGTLFHTITREVACELQLMGKLGIQATTIGNHEFDYGVSGLSQMLLSASTHGYFIPEILSTNIHFSQTDPQDDDLEQLMHNGFIKRYKLMRKDGITFGILGILGNHAIQVTKNAFPVRFDDPIDSARKMANFLKNQHKADIVIMLAHCGALKDKNGEWMGDEIEIVQAVPEIDIVVGGHSHNSIHNPLIINNTPVLHAGHRLSHLGECEFSIESKGIKIISHQLHPVSSAIQHDNDMTVMINQFKTIVNDNILKPHQFTFDQRLVEIFQSIVISIDKPALGNLITDAFRKACQSDIAITGHGTIRGNMIKGNTGILTVSDVFRITPLGKGILDDKSGYPLIKLYLTAKELKKVFDVILAAYKVKGDVYYPHISGISILCNDNRILFDKIMTINIANEKEYTEIDFSDSNKLYSVACTSYVGSFLWDLSHLCFGIYSVVPKDEKGNPLNSIQDAIFDADKIKEGTQELKEWLAFFSYLRSFPDSNNNGIPDIPLNQSIQEKRIQTISSWKLTDLFHNATYVTHLVTGVLVVLLIVIFVFVKKFVHARWLNINNYKRG